MIYSVSAVAQSYYSIPSSGVITQKNMLADPNTIDWGFVSVGAPVVRQVTLLNTGNTGFAGLNMTVSDVQGLSSFDCGWNLEGAGLEPGANVTAEFTLVVQGWSSLSFSFDIMVGG